jgi:phage baseplate assembly protein W
MIPISGLTSLKDIDEIIPKNRTYKLNLLEGKIDGYIDGLSAIKQGVFKILETQRYQYLIYDFSYGSELNELIGKDSDYIQMEIRRRITEALITDDRIIDVTDFVFVNNRENMIVTFRVISKEGSFESEVIINV